MVGKLASVCFESLGKAHERHKYFVLLATPMDTTHYVLSAHAHNLAQSVGNGRQQAAGMEPSDIDAAARAGYVLYRAFRLLYGTHSLPVQVDHHQAMWYACADVDKEVQMITPPYRSLMTLFTIIH